MDLAAAGLREQPFRTHGKPLSIVSYSSQLEAIDVLQQTCDSPTGLSLIQGPSLSGKSTLIRLFIETVPDDCAHAVIDGDGMNTKALLESLLRQFGYELAPSIPASARSKLVLPLPFGPSSNSN